MGDVRKWGKGRIKERNGGRWKWCRYHYVGNGDSDC